MENDTLNKKIDLAEKILSKNSKADIGFILSNIQSDTVTSQKSFLKEYFYSIIFSPIGIWYFLKFTLLGTYKKQGIICLILTLIILLIEVKVINSFFSSASITNLASPQGFNTLKTLGY